MPGSGSSLKSASPDDGITSAIWGADAELVDLIAGLTAEEFEELLDETVNESYQTDNAHAPAATAAPATIFVPEIFGQSNDAQSMDIMHTAVPEMPEDIPMVFEEPDLTWTPLKTRSDADGDISMHSEAIKVERSLTQCCKGRQSLPPKMATAPLTAVRTTVPPALPSQLAARLLESCTGKCKTTLRRWLDL